MATIDKVEILLKELRDKKLFFDKGVNYLEENRIEPNREESLRLIEELIKDDVFLWLQLIGYLLEKSASSDPHFLKTLSEVMKKTKGDMAQGILIEYLVKIGLNKPDLAITIYRNLKDAGQLNRLAWVCYMLGGVGRSNFGAIAEIVREGLMSPKPENNVASLVALRVSFTEKMEPRWKDLVFSLLEIVNNTSSAIVKRELANVYMIFYKYDHGKCFSNLIGLAKEEDEGVRYILSQLLCGRRLDGDHHFSLLEILANSKESSILDNVSLSIALQLKREDMCNGLRILRRWLKDGKFYDIRFLPIALNKLGEQDLALCLGQIQEWVKEDREIKVPAPTVALEFAKGNFEALKDSIIDWIDDSDLRDFALETIRQLLEKIFERSDGGRNPSIADKEIISELLKKLRDVARLEKLDPERISNRDELDIYKCLILIEEIERKYEELDYGKIWENLERLPNIKSYLGEKWIRRMEREQNKTHPLLIYLAEDLLNSDEYLKKTEEIKNLTDMVERQREVWRAFGSVERYALLSHLDQELKVIGDQPNIGQIKDALRNEEQFWKVFSEIDVIARLGQSFKVKISPKIAVAEDGRTRVKHPDLEVTVNSYQFFIEVISPEMFKPLRYFRSAAIPNRLRSKVTEELRKHFMGMEIDRDIVLVVDMGSSEIDYYAISDYVEGPLQMVIRTDRRTGRVIDTFVERGKPMAEVDEEAREVTGIIGYRRIFSSADRRIHLKGRAFPNPHVLDKEKREKLEMLAKVILG